MARERGRAVRRTVALILAALLALSLATCGAEYDAKRDIMIYNNDRAVVARVQEVLNALGYDCGKADGITGNKTVNAIKAWEAATGVPELGVIDDSMLQSLGLSDLIKPVEKPLLVEELIPQEEPVPVEEPALIPSQPIEDEPAQAPAPDAPESPATPADPALAAPTDGSQLKAVSMPAIDYTYINDNQDMFTVSQNADAGAVFIEAKLSAQERAFIHKYESTTRYSSTKFDVIVVNYGTPSACPVLRLWITYCADDDYLDITAATFDIAGRSYTFTNMTPSLSQDEQGCVEQQVIMFGPDNLEFLADLEDLFSDTDDAASEAMAMRGQLVLHGREDLTVDLGGGFFLDYLVMKSGFIEMNGIDFLQYVDETPMTIE